MDCESSTGVSASRATLGLEERQVSMSGPNKAGTGVCPASRVLEEPSTVIFTFQTRTLRCSRMRGVTLPYREDLPDPNSTSVQVPRTRKVAMEF